MKMRKKFLVVLMSLAMALTAIPATVYGADPGASGDSGFNLDKKAEQSTDGSVTIQMDAYVTGKTVTTTEVVNADIVLVLDQSGSMAERMSGSTTKQAALKAAANSFIANVAKANKEDGADNRIAIVTYASSATQLRGWTKADSNALQSSINNLTNSPAGATRTDLGMEKAYNLINGLAPSTDRKRVVVMLSDGAPTDVNGFNLTVANKAVDYARQCEAKGATVYSIGIFPDANPTQMTYNGSGSWGGTKTYSNSTNASNYNASSDNISGAKLTALANRFMNVVSSNYNSANMGLSINYGTTYGGSWFSSTCYRDYTYSASTLTPANRQYYKTASTAAELSKVFEAISTDVNTPACQADATTQIIDQVNTGYFSVPTDGAGNAEIELYTVNKTKNGWETTETPVTDPSVKATVLAGNVIVTGYDFAANYVSATDKNGNGDYGQKLVIRFKEVPKADAMKEAMADGTNEFNTNLDTNVKLGAQAILNGQQLDDAASPKASYYQVEYAWTNAPATETLPVDGGVYANGQTYTVDDTYQAGDTVDKVEDGVVVGTYTFQGWDATGTQTMGNANVTHRGNWTFEDAPTYAVDYAWDGDIPSTGALPAGAASLDPGAPTLPAGKTGLYNGSTYTVDGTYPANYKVKALDGYGNTAGIYTFGGWDQNGNITISGNLTIQGTWTYQEQDIAKHNVTYQYDGDVPPTGICPALPAGETGLVKGQTHTVDTTVAANPQVEEKDAYGNVIAIYTFEGWDSDGPTVTMGDADITITGTWSKDPVTVAKHRVTYSWTGDIPATGATLPVDPNRYVNNQPYEVDDDYTKTTTINKLDGNGNVEGTYRFSGWKNGKALVEGTQTMGNEDVALKGVWTYEAAPTYDVTYTWDGDIPGTGALPAGVASLDPGAPTLPAGKTGLYAGQIYTVDGTYPANYTVKALDAYGNTAGLYTFGGWDQTGDLTIAGNVTIQGTWTYTPQDIDKHNVTYQYDGEVPPTGICPALPAGETGLVKGQAHTVDTTVATGLQVEEKDAYGNVMAVYTFQGWDQPTDTVIMGDADITITGTWTKADVTVTPHSVTYQWTGDIPATGVTLPVDTNTYVNNQPYNVDGDYTKTTTRSKLNAQGNVEGTYRFSGWMNGTTLVEGTQTMGNADVTLTGVWTYEAAPTYNVNYQFKGQNSDADIPNQTVAPDLYLPPYLDSLALSGLVDGDEFTIDNGLNGRTYEVKDAFGNVEAVYSFQGWDLNGAQTIQTSDVIVTGIWSVAYNQIQEYTVEYEWTGNIPTTGVTLPVDMQYYYRVNEPYNVDATYTAGYTVDDVDAEGNVLGTWTFSGWDKTGTQIMGTENVILRGVWAYAPALPIPGTDGDDDPAPTPNLDPVIPSTGGNAQPKTGDTAQTDGYMALLLGSGLLLAVAACRRKNRSEQNQ